MGSNNIGYARVSSVGQSLELQLEKLKEAGCTTIYREKVSGAKSDRKELMRMLKKLEEGDEIVVTRIDRLARSTFDLFDIVRKIVDAGATFKSLGEPWADTGTSTGRLMIAILGGLADVERDLIRTRTAEGRARAKAKGKHLGRPAKLTLDQRREALERRANGECASWIFDEHNVTFVSVTQSFNTTTSMGRLTLNVLLSFAQFEREVTGERIRDKVAASKKKGMWMGGYPPMGYERDGRSLIVKPKVAKLVGYIYEQYLVCGSVKLLKEKLDAEGVRTPARISKIGNEYGNANFSAGHLYHLLSNPVYIGKVRHKGQTYDGLHEPIIGELLFQKVQEQLASNRIENRGATLPSGSLLQKKLFDAEGTPYSPTYTSKQGKKRYTYYVNQALLQFKGHPKGLAARLPAHEIEKVVKQGVTGWLQQVENFETYFTNIDILVLNHLRTNPIQPNDQLIRKITQRAEVHKEALTLTLSLPAIQQELKATFGIELGKPIQESIAVSIPFEAYKINHGAIVIEPKEKSLKDPFDLPPEVIKRVVKGTIWRDEHFAGKSIEAIAKDLGHSPNYVRRSIMDSLLFLTQ